MLNCKNCGAPLSLEEPVCAYCGTPNPEAKEYLGRQQVLDGAVASARREVVDEVKKVKRGYSLLVILAVLLFANLVLLPLHEASYEVAGAISERGMSQKEITATLDGLLDEGEYIEMAVFAEKRNLRYSDYRDYMTLSSLAMEYNGVVEYVTRYYHGTDNYEDPLVRACQRITSYEDIYRNYRDRDLSPDMLGHIEKLNAEFESYLKAFLRLTDKDIAALATMSDTRLLVLVDERLHDEE